MYIIAVCETDTTDVSRVRRFLLVVGKWHPRDMGGAFAIRLPEFGSDSRRILHAIPVKRDDPRLRAECRCGPVPAAYELDHTGSRT